jgi:hypothetical protein
VCVCLGVCAFVCERGRGRESERGHVHGFESIPLTCVSYEEEDTCVSYEEEGSCGSYDAWL